MFEVDCLDLVKLQGLIEKRKNYILLNVDMEKTSISEVVEKYSKICEINDINVLTDNIDDVIIKLYEGYNL